MVSQYAAVAVTVAACLAVGVHAGQDVRAVIPSTDGTSSWDNPGTWSRGFEPCAGDTVVLNPASSNHFITVEDSNNWVLGFEMPLADGDTGIIFEEGEDGVSGFYFAEGDGCTGMPSPAPTGAPATSEPSPAPTDAPATSEPSPAPTDAPATSEPSPAPTDAPATSEPSPAPTDASATSEPTATPTTDSRTMVEICAAILCPAECGDSDSATREGLAGCGWSKGAGGCVFGGRTTGSELLIECNSPPAATDPPVTSEPSPAPTTGGGVPPQTCAEILCPSACNSDTIPGTVCGWSRGNARCQEGGRTTASELQLPCNSPPDSTVPPPPPTPSAPTEAEAPTMDEICAAILCPAECGDSDSATREGLAGCGWSKGAGGCVFGGRTTGSELLIECNSPITDTATSPPATPDAGTVPCEDIACSYLCTGACGWSRGKTRCQEGATTSASELADNLALEGYVADSEARTCTPV